MKNLVQFISTKNIIRRFLNRMARWYANLATLRYLARIKSLEIETPQTADKRALIFTGFTLNNIHVRTDILFSEILAESGFNVSIFYCAGLFSTCEFASPKDNDLSIGRNCDACKKFARGLIALSKDGDIVGLSSIALSAKNEELLAYYLNLYEKESLSDLINLYLDEVNLHEHIMSTYCRQTLTGPKKILEVDENRYRLIGHNVVKAVVYTSQILDEYNPTLVVCTHGVYLNHGPLTDLCRSRSIQISVWGVPYRRGTFFITKGDTYHRALLPHSNKTEWNVPLSSFERQRAVKYLESKESGGRDYWSYFGEKESGVEQGLVDLASEKQLITLFTNVDWDAQIFYDGNIFESQTDWIEQTLVILRKQTHKHLVIRVHPAEADIFKSRSSVVFSVRSLIRKHSVRNVTLVEPDDTCSSYVLMKLSCCALIYGSKISLECAYRGIPTVIVGNSVFRQSEFSYLPRSVRNYETLLLGDTSSIVGQTESAIRYAHYLYFRVFQECKWATDLFDPTSKFTKLTRIQRQELADALIYGTA